ncbi:MAG: tRNA dihydrouridine(20/20a) synthase DusA [Hyphomicrobiales bacterium]|nr:tRNA dihydrouridine(20/20a) synthase DusA [Hyphomicrobiales bacterium]
MIAERIFAVAPMMEWTDRHCRYFHRLLTARALLYTEMVTADAVIHGDRERLIGFSEEEQPVAVQLGGSDPTKLAAAARIAEGFGYREINLNVGCPSDRVQSGRFGACLMAEPALVAECVAAMQAAVSLPVTVKCRIGIDDQDAEDALDTFIDTVAAAGCTTFVIHARKAWLEGLSPRENRDVPPLDQGRVYRLKARRPDLCVVLNGGIGSLDEAAAHLAHLDGVMMGRAAYQSPWRLAEADGRLFGDRAPAPEPAEIVERMIPYIERELARGTRLHRIARHMTGLFQGVPGARAWRRTLSEEGVRPDAGVEVLRAALALVRPQALAAAE